MDVVRRDKLDNERREDVGEENNALWQGADEVLRCRENDDIENIIDKTWRIIKISIWRSRKAKLRGNLPKSQKATATLMSGCFNTPLMREL